jgi:diguanylate cyclase (GGDEF)-like protein
LSHALGPGGFCGCAVIENVKHDLSDYLVAEIAVVDQSGAIVHCNRKWEETAKTGMLFPKLTGWNYIEECEAAIKRGSIDAVGILAGLRAVLLGALPSFVSNYSCPFNGVHHWFQILISAFEVNGTRHAMLMHVDVSALQRDPLTGLSNRAMFDAQLDLALSLARDTSRCTGLMIIDMNNLKLINDLHGHATGDAALKALAAELKKAAGPDCLVARIGGDEFGVVLPVSQDTLLARRVRAHLGSGVTCSIGATRSPTSVSASVGIALYPDDATTASELYKSADKSMYAHKRGLSVA